MKLNNKKIDILLKLVFYMFPILYIFICAIATKSVELVTFEAVLTNLFSGVVGNGTMFDDFFNWFVINISSANVVLFIMHYVIYVVFVEFIVLFKNVMIFIFRVANDFIERGVGK